jgi:hypothetical protein
MRTVLLGSSKSEPLEIQALIRWPCDRPPERLGRLVGRQAGSRDGSPLPLLPRLRQSTDLSAELQTLR